MVETAATFDKILIEENETKTVSTWKLNFTAKLNIIDFDMVSYLTPVVQAYTDKPSEAPRAVILVGEGGKAFSAGGDVVSIYNAKIKKENETLLEKYFKTEFALDYAIAHMKPFQISIWNGFTLGGGVGLSIHSNVKIATDNTMFAMPETAIGFFTDVSGGYFLPRIKGNPSLGLFLGTTGFRVKGRDCVKWGIATHFVSSDKLAELQQKLRDSVTAEMTDAEITAIVESFADKSAADGDIEDLAEIQEIFQMDSAKEMMARLEASESEFATQTKKLLSKMSPLSVAITYELIKRGATMSHEDVVAMELIMTQNSQNGVEMYEGIRAALVDKDRAPKWSHKHVNDVTEEEIAALFK